ncbi:hypothetical protein [Modestobacter altitudinis]|uniref:hypothetical protein n=1 Tax=Modestobacter altitudinis TaxID=2213158 RepID=UPI00110D0C9A|nr:hypothetical protein [Modestobacter altitudinis]
MTTPEWDAAPPYAGPPQYPGSQYGDPQYGNPQYGSPQYLGPQYPAGPYPPQFGTPPSWGPPPYAAPGYPPPGWGWAPRPPQLPGSVIAAAVIAFASTLLVLLGTVYAMAFSALLSLSRGPGSGVGTWVAVVQLALAALLVVGGVRALGGDRRWLLVAAAAQLAMSVYWLVVLVSIAPSTVNGSVAVLPVLYGALALVAGGLLVLPDARARAARRPGPAADGGPDAGG